MKLIYALLILLCTATQSVSAQILNLGDEVVVEKIKHSDKQFKLIYIFCNYCQISIERYPKVVQTAQNNKNIEAFFICAQDSSDIVLYTDTCKMKAPMYLINQDRKRKMISFYNPIEATCKYLKKRLGIDTAKMGASDFCILDKDGKIIIQTDWETDNNEYFRLLDECLNRL